MEDKKQTIVGGQPTGDLTDSGNYIHNSDGTFGSKNDAAVENNSGEYIDWDNLEFGELSDEDIINMINNSERKYKNVEEMSTQELILEIKECEKTLEKHFDKKDFKKLFPNDLRIKCINFRYLKEIIEKFNFGLDGTSRIQWYGRFGDYSSVLANVKPVCETLWERDSEGFITGWKLVAKNPCERIHINAKQFNALTLDGLKKSVKRQIDTGFKVDVEEEYYAAATLIHEMGHVLCHKILMDNDTDFFKEVEHTENIRKEIFEEYKKMDQNKNVLKTYDDFINECAEYGRDNGSTEWFAEIFKSLCCGKPTDSAKAMGIWLKKKGYMKED